MLVDKLLIFFGRDPRGYYSGQDKWIVVSVYAFNILTPWLPLIFAIIPWLVLFIQKKWMKKHVTRAVLIKTGLLSVILAIVGYYLPDIIIGIMGGLAVRALYGG